MEEGRGDMDAPGEAPAPNDSSQDSSKFEVQGSGFEQGAEAWELNEKLPPQTEEPKKNAPDVVKAAGAAGQGLTDGKIDEEKENSEKEISAIREWLELIGRAGFWALILYLFFFQVSVVEGPSMQPTFTSDDRLVIDKLTYRFSDVHRFDVVVFQAVEARRYRGPNDTEESKDYIK